MRVVKLPQALIDLVETAFYLADDDPEVADRFFDSFELTLKDIRKTPKIGSLRRFKGQKDIRMWFVRGFRKSIIFYTENSHQITILRVIHSARDYNRFFEIE